MFLEKLMNSASVLRVGPVEVLFSFDLPIAVSKDNTIIVLRSEERKFKTNGKHISGFLHGRKIAGNASRDDLNDAIVRAMRSAYAVPTPSPSAICPAVLNP